MHRQRNSDLNAPFPSGLMKTFSHTQSGFKLNLNSTARLSVLDNKLDSQRQPVKTIHRNTIKSFVGLKGSENDENRTVNVLFDPLRSERGRTR